MRIHSTNFIKNIFWQIIFDEKSYLLLRLQCRSNKKYGIDCFITDVYFSCLKKQTNDIVFYKTALQHKKI